MSTSGGQALPEFVSEPLEPHRGTFDAAAMSRGEPGVPRAFTWRKNRYEVAAVLSRWKTSSADRGEMYLRRHWFEIATTDGKRMKVYCERQAKNRKRPKARWWIYAVTQ